MTSETTSSGTSQNHHSIATEAPRQGNNQPPNATGTPSQISPAGCYITSRQRDPKFFTGLGEDEVDEWLDLYNRIGLHNRWDDATKLSNIIFYFTDVARTWFLNHEAEFLT